MRPALVRPVGLFVLLLAPVVVVACKKAAPPPPAVAWIGETPVLAAELEAELSRVLVESEGEIRHDAEGLAALRRAVLADLIDRRLLLAEATASGLSVTEPELDQAMRRFSPPPEGAGESFEAVRRERVRDQLLVDRYLLREVVARVAVSPDEVRAWYDENTAQERPEQLRAAQILVATREDADVIRRDLHRGADFAMLARTNSISADAAAGGDLGWFSPGSLPPEIEEECRKLRKGQVSEVVQTPYGFQIFKLLDRRPGRRVPFEEAEQGIELELRRQAVTRAQAAFMEKLRAASPVRYVEEEIDRMP